MSNPFGELKALFEHLDLKKIASLARKIDLGQLAGLLLELTPEDLAHLASQVRAKHHHQPLPVADGDFYQLGSLLNAEDQALRGKVRAFMQERVAPNVNEWWLRGEFPHEIIPAFAALDIAGLTFKGYGFSARSCVLEGLLAEEIARVDVSISTFFGVQSGLAMGSGFICVAPKEQKNEYLPKMRRFELLGAFGLTEPDVGSGVAGGFDDDLPPRRRQMDFEWQKEMDRKCHVFRFHDHLGAR